MTAPRSAPWTPLLEGPARDDALDAIAAIAAVASGAIEDWSRRHPDDAGANAHSLAWGRSGIALFHAYLDAAGLAPPGDDRAATLMDAAIDALAASVPGASLHVGFSGVAWVIAHVASMARGEGTVDEPDAAADIDDALEEHLATPRPGAEWDLVQGLVGLGVYACERRSRPAGRRCLALVVRRLEELARITPGGLAWEVPAGRPGADDAGRGPFDLGVAHGVPGVLALLGRALEAGVEPERCRALLEPGVAWLLAQQLAPGALSCFPTHAGPGAAPLPSRCGWCYGDPGVAVALLGVARRAGVAAWEREAVRIARHAAAVRSLRDDVVDAQLCHGSAGVAHAFHRLAQATGDPELRAAARFWYEHALRARLPGRGLAGYRTWSLERTPDGEWQDDPRLLTGIAGIGLALIAAVTHVEPEWDRVLLMS